MFYIGLYMFSTEELRLATGALASHKNVHPCKDLISTRQTDRQAHRQAGRQTAGPERTAQDRFL